MERGYMPHTRRLIEEEGYVALPYRCGVPSTTPFAQAGILFGDDREIPSYRWWDKESGQLVAFGNEATFRHVSHLYFQGCRPLTEGGACIAALYRTGQLDELGPAYEERHRPSPDRALIRSFLLDPVRFYFWVRHGGWSLYRILLQYVGARLRGFRPAEVYVFADLFHEVVVHHLTRYAVIDAMARGVRVIYGCFYTYDEAAHAFGPDDDKTLDTLRHIDNTVRFAAAGRRSGPVEYDLVVLSDHGQVECTPFAATDGKHLGDLVSEWLPHHEVVEHRGRTLRPRGDRVDGHVDITYSGGLGHLYFRDVGGRLDLSELERRFPGFVGKVAALDRVDFVMVRDGRDGLLLTRDGSHRLGRLTRAAREFLARLDEPEVIAAQLRHLNSFERSGDLVIFGRYDGRRQVNFENQVGGHGSAGGAQLHPFLLVNKDWGIDTSRVLRAADLHPLLVSLRDRP
jgi:predicted AlkP superfamily pyrophosphatase or phosphodiesterase